MFRLENIVKYYSCPNGGIAPVLCGANLVVQRGEFCVVVGASGAGKTSLLYIAGLLDKPNFGSVFLGSNLLSNMNEKERSSWRAKNVGVLYQHHHLIGELTSRENVALPLLLRGVSKEVALESAKETMCMMNIESKCEFYPESLSVGQKQRVAISRALISDPDIILADEPTGNLDNENAIGVFNLLKSVVKKKNKICITITHNQDLAESFADKVVRVQGGCLI